MPELPEVEVLMRHLDPGEGIERGVRAPDHHRMPLLSQAREHALEDLQAQLPRSYSRAVVPAFEREIEIFSVYIIYTIYTQYVCIYMQKGKSLYGSGS